MSARNYFAWDIEIAAEVPSKGDWKDQRPLGITCAGFAWYDGDEVKATVVRADGDRMPPDQVDEQIVGTLLRAADSGMTVTGWNTLGFDFDILAEECGSKVRKDVVALAFSNSHVDPMFDFFVRKGYPVGLQWACKGMGLEGKLEGMTGADAPRLWASGDPADRDKVCKYVAQDAVEQLRLAVTAERRSHFSWLTKRGEGSKRTMRLGSWRGVADAMAEWHLHPPDQSWMTEPWPMERFTGWREGALR